MSGSSSVASPTQPRQHRDCDGTYLFLFRLSTHPYPDLLRLKQEWMKKEYAYYLGDPNLMGCLRWQESNPFNVIFPNDHTETDSDVDEQVPLAFIGQISDEKFKFTPIGGFRPGSYKSPLSKEKATCVIRCPDMEDYEQEWNFIESNVESIQAMAPGQCRVPKNFWSGLGNQRGIRVCHTLFEVSNWQFIFLMLVTQSINTQEFSGIRPSRPHQCCSYLHLM